MAGGTPLTIGGGTIADMVPPNRRGAITAIFTLGMLVGPVIGLTVGGFLSQAKGWRWIFWLLTILSGAMTIASAIFLRETYPPLLLSRRAARLRKERRDGSSRSGGNPPPQRREVFARAIMRPLKMLFLSPVNTALALYMAIIFGIIYLILATFPVVFQVQYSFSEGLSGLSCAGVGVGVVAALVVLGHYSDVVYKKLTIANHGRAKPEFRLVFLVCGVPVAPAGIITYGWTAQEKVHWIAPIIGTVIFGVGSVIALVAIQTYLVDAFPEHAASALAANSLLRSIAGGLIPLAGLTLNKSLGLGWSNMLLGLLALAFGVPPAVFYWYGESLRQRYAVHLA
ncbi:MAG: hypothetical protein M1839_000947 [Geoglossum umbratile]|nr:MAG: hypothetical protein M1839_000947 [Geoglossum umbratile]